MTYTVRPRGVCSQVIQIDLDEAGIVRDLSFTGGCSGNLQGIAKLVIGMPAQEVIKRLRGIKCGFKPTSCPDQLAQGLEMILAQQK